MIYLTLASFKPGEAKAIREEIRRHLSVNTYPSGFQIGISNDDIQTEHGKNAATIIIESGKDLTDEIVPLLQKIPALDQYLPKIHLRFRKGTVSVPF